MTVTKFVKYNPLTAIMILCWIIGATYFGCRRLFVCFEEAKTRPLAQDQLFLLSGGEVSAMPGTGETSAPEGASAAGRNGETAAAGIPLPYVKVDPQNVSKDAESAKAAVAAMAEEKRRAHPFSAVDASYLDDAVFIGDSRTDTLRLYAGWDNACYYVKTGVSIWTIMDVEVEEAGQMMSIDSALASRRFGKVYIMLGVNELGTGTAETFYQKFRDVVARIRELQPDALIFVQSIMHVSQSVNGSETVVDNETINTRNSLLKKLADNDMVYYIDENEVLDDEEGCLTDEWTYDGIHLQAQYIEPWKKFILEHGVVK